VEAAMAKMRAVQVARAGGPLELVEREMPEPAPAEFHHPVPARGWGPEESPAVACDYWVPDGAVGFADRHLAADLSRRLGLAQTLTNYLPQQVVVGPGQYLASAASSGRRAGSTARMYPANTAVAELRFLDMIYDRN
jgi:hypothetical protein